eukprot:Awhi_evm1s11461
MLQSVMSLSTNLLRQQPSALSAAATAVPLRHFQRYHGTKITTAPGKPKLVKVTTSGESWDDYYTSMQTGSKYTVEIDHLPADKGGKGPTPLELTMAAFA